ncbi:MAG: spirocyclase AveC family protein [Novosphingobium sp.]
MTSGNVIAASTPVAKASKAVFVWGALGATFLVTQAYVYGSWILSPDFHAVPLGPDPVPDIARISMKIYEILSVVTLVTAVTWFVRGIQKTRAIDSTRLLMVGWLSANWLDPFLNFLSPMFTYNAVGFNRGCWCNFIPFWQSANGAGYAEPLLVVPPAYFYTFTGTAIFGLMMMQKAKSRWPSIGNIGLCLAGFAGVWMTMGLLDIVATRYLGFDGWPGAFRNLSFWGGQSYQFPIYEAILFPTPFVACAFLLFYADTDGRTAIERGLEHLVAPAWKLQMFRILAFVGFCNVLNLTYTTAMGIHAVYADPWPAIPSWLANGQCGGTTGIVCTKP